MLESGLDSTEAATDSSAQDVQFVVGVVLIVVASCFLAFVLFMFLREMVGHSVRVVQRTLAWPWDLWAHTVPAKEKVILPPGTLTFDESGQMMWEFRTPEKVYRAPIYSFADIPGSSNPVPHVKYGKESARRDSIPVPREPPGSQVLIYYDTNGPMPEGVARRVWHAVAGKPAHYEPLGAGFIMAGRLVTAGHVVRDALMDHLALGVASAKAPTTVYALPKASIAWDRPYATDGDEFVMFDLPLGLQSRLGVTNAKTRPPRANEVAYAFSGNYAGQAATVTRTKDTPLMWLHQCSTERGDSGMPILGRDNFVIGMHIGSREEGNIFLDVVSLYRALTTICGKAEATTTVSDDPLVKTESVHNEPSYTRIPEDSFNLLPEREKRTALVTVGGQVGLAVLGVEGFSGRGVRTDWADIVEVDEARAEVEDLLKYDASLEEVMQLSGAAGDRTKSMLVQALYDEVKSRKRMTKYQPESGEADFCASGGPTAPPKDGPSARNSLDTRQASFQTLTRDTSTSGPTAPVGPSTGDALSRNARRRLRKKAQAEALSASQSPKVTAPVSQTTPGPNQGPA